MKKSLILFLSIIIYLSTFAYGAEKAQTMRIPQFENHKVKVWETIIYPSHRQILASHRHEHDRVLVALTDGILKVTNNKGKVHHLNLKKNTAYYLLADAVGEKHTDENLSGQPIQVMIVELL